ncbi:TIGR00645 family protein [Microterricola viridarii]|uniref:TIGR00645 family protein n=1 Tax=Microterricola viridarii TaxID=412690 RepID=UPI000ADCA4EC|nr:TIGR00645 family protein [Microterricola viridarii]
MNAPEVPSTARRKNPLARWANAIGYLIFLSRWLQAPLYLGLIVAQGLYAAVFINELIGMSEAVLSDPMDIDANSVMLGVLGLIDVVMVANLVIMVVVGGYETFVSKIDTGESQDRPEWLSQVNANVLKTKLAMSIVGISSIHLLKTFIEVSNLGGSSAHGATETYTVSGVLWQSIIHTIFIVSAISLAWIDRWGAMADFEERELVIEETEAGIR